MPIPRSYHHGGVRHTAITVGLAAAREGGVNAVTVREVTRRIGVSPNAVYRHFADHRALVVAVALEAQEKLAETMRARIAALTDGLEGTDAAVAQLRGVGLGYIEFALAEPGWFETALLTFDPQAGGEVPTVEVDAAIPAPFQLLLDALDACVATGAMAAEVRPGAEWPCWSAVHGFADIATRGPLKGHDSATLAAMGERVVEAIVRGVQASTQPSADAVRIR